MTILIADRIAAIAEREDERKWLVWYHDPDMPPELIVRGGNAEAAARRRHKDQLGAWSCHLFTEVFPGEPSIAALQAELAASEARVKQARREGMEAAAKWLDDHHYSAPAEHIRRLK